MRPFCFAFLLPALVAQVFTRALGDGVAWCLVGVTLALLKRRPRLGVLVLLGVALYGLSGRAGEAGPTRLEPGLVTVEGVVAAPPTVSRDTWRITLESPPHLQLDEAPKDVLEGDRVRAFGFIDGSRPLVRVPSGKGFEVIARSPWSVTSRVAAVRAFVRARLNRAVGPVTSGYLRALLLGDRALSRDDQQRLIKTGTLHLFAVSGLHLAVLLSLLRVPLGSRPLPLIALLLGYASLTGFRSPVGRALLLATGTLLGRVLRRRVRPLEHLALAAVILIAWDPTGVRSAGFLLSFSAFAGILTLGRPSRPDHERRLIARIQNRRRDRLRRGIHDGLRVSFAAFLGSLPASIGFFYRMSPMAIPASVLLAPLIPLLLILSAVLVTFPGCGPAAWLAETLVTSLRFTVGVLETVPFASLDVASPHPFAWVLFGASVLLRIKAQRPRARRASLVAVLVATAILARWSDRQQGVFLLEAGRGSSLLAVGTKEAWLVDCGPGSARVAEQVLALGIGRLDGVIITHAHEDHAGGLPEVESRLRPQAVLGIGDHLLAAGFVVRSAGLKLRTLWPETTAHKYSKNDGSVVVRIDTPFGSVLSTGDVETRGLRDLLATGTITSVDVLVVPHHGGHNHALLDLVYATTPRQLWIPARALGPAPESLLLLASTGIPIRTTGLEGVLALPPTIFDDRVAR